jgi:hypothetical protein
MDTDIKNNTHTEKDEFFYFFKPVKISIICSFLYIWYNCQCHPYHHYHMQQGHAHFSQYVHP